eukprot:TRINITY_DN35085_c0_g1_i1.p1 TRINITY_DN35085_c0_g1~~TRINITY_DN35085_c0_g1_i1.p1  ORF type:complete len:363 (-),score=55.57 TRINITY_DN35085_c0_g1_i1:186-1274(-)
MRQTAEAREVQKLSGCCRTLQGIRRMAQLRQTARSSVAGLAPFPEAEAEAEALLLALAGLSGMRLSRHLLQKTGIGREVNHRFLRMHPCAAVRDFSHGLVCTWKSAVAQERNLMSSQHAWRETYNARTAPKQSDEKRKHESCNQAAIRKIPKTASHGLMPEGDGDIVIVDDEDEQDPQRANHESGRAPTPESTPGSNPCMADMSQWTVSQLKSKIRELGLSSVGCTEKRDLVVLLSTAAANVSVQTLNSSPRHFKRRMTLGRAATSRLSLLRRRRPDGEASQSAKLSKVPSQRHQLERVMRAKNSAALLGLCEKEMRSRCLVKKRFCELSRLVHPDKCPPELRAVATQAFSKLKAAVGKLLS